MINVVEALRTSKGPVTVALDEGGLRCTWKDGGGAYVPFEALTDATLDTTIFGTTMLVASLASGGEVRVKIANGNPFDVLGAIVAHVGERRFGGDGPPLAHPAFDRGDLELGAWLEGVRRHACGGEAYRDAPPDRDHFAALLEDDRCPATLRAAAVHALLAIGTDDDLRVVAQALVNRALPPLVLVAAGLGPGGSALVDDELLAEMRTLLSASDRDAVTDATTAERSDPVRTAHVAAALVTAKETAASDARNAAEARDRGASGRRALHPVASSSGAAGNAGRWVGRSWGL